MKSIAKSVLEKLFKCRIYRVPLPRGVDLFLDLEKEYSLQNFKVVFDVGANVGQSAITYYRKFPVADVYCFEPTSQAYEQLCKNTSKLAKRIKVFRNAIGETLGTIDINLNDDSRINSIKYNETGTSESVEMETIDNFLSKSEIERIDFLKVDTEGFEREVLNGAKIALSENRIGILNIEAEPVYTNRTFVPYSALVDRLEEFNYKLFGIYDQQAHWTGEKNILFFNLVFICNDLVKGNLAVKSGP